jgi:hypothetical protein
LYEVEKGFKGAEFPLKVAKDGFFLCGFTWTEDNNDGKVGMDGLRAEFCNS